MIQINSQSIGTDSERDRVTAVSQWLTDPPVILPIIPGVTSVSGAGIPQTNKQKQTNKTTVLTVVCQWRPGRPGRLTDTRASTQSTSDLLAAQSVQLKVVSMRSGRPI